LLVVHVYHHAITLLLATFMYYRIGAIARWGVLMNLSTHILMYGYFCAQTLTKQIPRRFAVIITFLQTAQFAAGFLIVLLAKRYLKVGMKCEVNAALLNFNLLALAAFFVLFSHHYATKFCNLDAQTQNHRQERLKRF
uniref:Elongation of very long chain fatty acids protein n=1 Tax=Anisakis simplex TaxID=6269 RepID=A0A0M3JPC9_ANISI